MRRLVAWVRLHAGALLLCLLPMAVLFGYITSYARLAPITGQWLTPVDIAFAAQEGTLDAAMVFQEVQDRDFVTSEGAVYSEGHLTYPSHIGAALLGRFTHWDTRIPPYVNFGVALLRWVLAGLIFVATVPRQTPWLLFPAALMMFSVYLTELWLAGFLNAAWMYYSACALAAVAALLWLPRDGRGLLAGLGCSALAMYTYGTGLVVMPVLALVLWMYGYRRVWHYALWLGAFAALLAFYASQSSIFGAGDDLAVRQNPSFALRPAMVPYVLAVLGSPLTVPENYTLAVIAGGLGMLALLANLAWLWHQDREPQRLAPWLSLAGFGGAFAVLIYVTRYDPDALTLAIEPRYSDSAWLFWLGVLGSGAAVVGRQPARALVGLNGAVLVWALVFFPQTQLWALGRTALDYQHPLFDDFYQQQSALNRHREEDCLRAFPLSGDYTCATTPIQWATPGDIYRMAYAGLGVFRDHPQGQMLPADYRPGDGIILDTSSAWLNLYLRRWHLGGPDEADVLHLAPPDSVRLIDYLQTPPAPLLPAPQAEMLPDDRPTWWVIFEQARAVNEPLMVEAMRAAGYLPTVYPLTDPAYSARFVVVRYQQAPDTLTPLYGFGDTLQLVGWQVLPTACDAAQLLTWWRAETPLEAQYALQVAALAPDGGEIASLQAGLTPVPNVFWEPGRVYMADTRLRVSCDTPPEGFAVSLLPDGAEDALPLRGLDDNPVRGDAAWLRP